MLSKKKGFTLLELLIVIGIVGILSVVMFRTYVTVSQITFRLQAEKNIMGEVFSFSQILQNLSEKSTIDYSKYTSLEATKGIVDVLYLTGAQGPISLFTSGDCKDVSFAITGFTQEELSNPCVLVMQHEDGNQINLTQSNLIQLSKIQFKILPFVANEVILGSEQDSGENTSQQAFLTLHKPGFWMLVTAYSPRFSSLEWTRRVSLPFQQFFSLK